MTQAVCGLARCLMLNWFVACSDTSFSKRLRPPLAPTALRLTCVFLFAAAVSISSVFPPGSSAGERFTANLVLFVWCVLWFGRFQLSRPEFYYAVLSVFLLCRFCAAFAGWA